MSYSKKLQKAMEKALDDLAVGRYLKLRPCYHHELYCRDCPWALFQDECTAYPYSCARVAQHLNEDEQVLATLFVALEAGVEVE